MNSREAERAIAKHFDRFARKVLEETPRPEEKQATYAFIAGIALGMAEVRNLRRTRYGRALRHRYWRREQ